MDLTDPEALDEFAKAFLKEHKHCDVLVNNAGVIVTGGPTEGMAQHAPHIQNFHHQVVNSSPPRMTDVIRALVLQVTSRNGKSVYSSTYWVP